MAAPIEKRRTYLWPFGLRKSINPKLFWKYIAHGPAFGVKSTGWWVKWFGFQLNLAHDYYYSLPCLARLVLSSSLFKHPWAHRQASPLETTTQPFLKCLSTVKKSTLTRGAALFFSWSFLRLFFPFSYTFLILFLYFSSAF